MLCRSERAASRREPPIARYNLCLVGFGNVGRAFVRLLVEKSGELRDAHGIEWRLTGIASRRLGWIAAPDGLEPAAILEGRWPAPSASPPKNVREWLAAARADVLFEASSLNRHTGQPAIDHLHAALEAGAHAISANKGPIVFAFDELRRLAKATGSQFLFESAVMDGVPIFSLFRHGLPAAELRGFRGLLNSTSNVVLTEMEAGRTLDEAVRRAQEIGVAETDPSDDLDGWDPAVKVAALVIVLMGVPILLEQIQRTGIRTLDPAAVRSARAAGKPYKLVCRAERAGEHVRASVRPEQVPLTDPMASMQGTTSCLFFDLDVFGLTVIEHKPGIVATAYGLLADFIRAVRGG
jgi:homoserine dehydrogenase